MNTQRRTFLTASMAAGTVAVAVSTGLLVPSTVLAAWPAKAFESRKLDVAMNEIIGTAKAIDSKDIVVEAPDIAENGAVVSVTVKSKIPNTESISLFVPVNAFPLSASYTLASNTDGFVTTRLKMAKTSDIVAYVKAGGKTYTAKKAVKVTLGGCGG